MRRFLGNKAEQKKPEEKAELIEVEKKIAKFKEELSQQRKTNEDGGQLTQALSKTFCKAVQEGTLDLMSSTSHGLFLNVFRYKDPLETSVNIEEVVKNILKVEISKATPDNYQEVARNIAKIIKNNFFYDWEGPCYKIDIKKLNEVLQEEKISIAVDEENAYPTVEATFFDRPEFTQKKTRVQTSAQALPKDEEKINQQALEKLQKIYDKYEKHLLPKVIKALEKTIKELEKGSNLKELKDSLDKIKLDFKGKNYTKATDALDTILNNNPDFKSTLNKHDSSKNVSRFRETVAMNAILKTTQPSNTKLQQFSSKYMSNYRTSHLINGSSGEKTKVMRATTAILADHITKSRPTATTSPENRNTISKKK